MSKIDRNGKITITGPDGFDHVIQEGKTLTPKSYGSYIRGSGIGIFKIFILILIFVVFYKFITSGEQFNFSFKSLIEIFANAPAVDIAWSNIDLTAYADWGPFNFLKSIWNPLASVWEFCFSIVGMLWQGLNFLMYFVRVLFV